MIYFVDNHIDVPNRYAISHRLGYDDAVKSWSYQHEQTHLALQATTKDDAIDEVTAYFIAAWMEVVRTRNADTASGVAFKFKPGDTVNWTNYDHTDTLDGDRTQGVNHGNRTIVERYADNGQPRYFITPHDAWWYPISENDLTLVNPNNQVQVTELDDTDEFSLSAA